MKPREFHWGFLQYTVIAGIILLLAPEFTDQRVANVIREVFLLSAILATQRAIGSHFQWISVLKGCWGVSATLALIETFPNLTPWQKELTILRLFLSAFIGAVCAFEILRFVFGRLRGSVDSIFGSIVAYIMIVHMFAQLYLLLLIRDPHCFRFPEYSSIQGATVQHDLLYFSLTTMTTLGYGDITPASEGARGIAMIEAITGQFYMGVIVAALAGFFASTADEKHRGTATKN